MRIAEPYAERILGGSGDDISWHGRQKTPPSRVGERVSSVVARLMFLTRFWDILVDPLARMTKGNYWTGRQNSRVGTFLFVFLLVSVSAGKSPSNNKTSVRKVCGSIDIRNDVSNFNQFKDCQVIEGNLQIVLLQDKACSSSDPDSCSINNITFPHLREVTGYIVLWRAYGLRSLGTLFPKLSVIRGRTLFQNYALVVFEMLDLQEMRLPSLTSILRGSVRIEKNKMLCYVDTIDWSLIAANGENFIGDNRPKGECLRCNPDCPTTSGELRCWSKEICQNVSQDCGQRGVLSGKECCHESCLGGCSGTSSKDCFVCRDVILEDECVRQCPSNMYKYLGRRCVTEDECYNITRPLELKDSNWSYPFRPIQGNCLPNCPPNYYEVPETHEGTNGKNVTRLQCRPCNGPCKKECQAANIDSISSAQQLAGCTHIKGSLEIQLRFGGNVVKELEESLSSVEEISGYLKVVRSYPLISLEFLKNLRVIKGEILDNNKSAFVLLDNENLQELWDWSTRKQNLTIEKGHLSFNFNPKLCYYKILNLKDIANLPNFTEEDAPRTNNGHLAPCNITKLTPYVAAYHSEAVLIKWKRFEHHDARTLLGYVIYHIKAPNRNVSLYDGRDACGNDGWRIDDVADPERDAGQNVTHLLTYLKPFTQYAYFIKTYVISTEGNGGLSSIQYFTTNPSTPTKPVDLQGYSNSSSEIVVSWKPPLEMNGNFTHYVIEVFEGKEYPLELRDNCVEPLVIKTVKQPPATTPPVSIKMDIQGCNCKESERSRLKDTDVVRQQKINFEDSLQNALFVKRSNSSYKTRSTREVTNMSENHRQQLSFLDDTDKGTGGTEPEKSGPLFSENLTGTKKVVKDLRYFTNYEIRVRACRERGPNEPLSDTLQSTHCSDDHIIEVRTQKSETADNIHSIEITTNGTQQEDIRLKWEEPPNPNGKILSYHIEYRRQDNDKYKPVVECIQTERFREQKEYVLRNLIPGNYSLRVLAASLAGEGQYSPFKQFVVSHPTNRGMSDVLVGIMSFIFICGVFLGLFMFWKRKNSGVPKLFANVNPEYVSAATVYVPDEWEVPRKNIELIRELGQGSFGMVYEGIARDIVKGQPEVRCAVKTVNEVATDRDRMEFLNEASVMKAFNTHHVVQLLGVVSEGQPTLVVMELMVNGDLKTYLRSHRPEVCEDQDKQPPTLKRILGMAIEIADGMAYLAAKKFVHRDLAARNCMVAEDLTVKIGDFGMTRDIYETDYYKKGTKGLLPVRWMAPESLKDGVFTSHSDVWSYGIVLWEMVTLASQPYQGLSNDQVLRYVIEGGVMERPENCPDKLYELMKLCWQHKPLARPHFLEFVNRLLPDASPNFCSNSYYHSPEGSDLRAHLEASDSEANLPEPETPLRIARDIEDFSVGGSEMDEEEEEADLEVEPPFVSPRRGFLSSVVRPDIWYKSTSKPATLASVSSSDSSRGSKVSNGSAATPTTVNGFIVGRSSNGTRTTQC